MVLVTGGGQRTRIWTLTLFKEKRIITPMMKVKHQQSIWFNFIYRAAVKDRLQTRDRNPDGWMCHT